MTKLYKYPISNAHEEDVRASGFDCRDPDKRHPVKPHELLQHIQTRAHGKNARAGALLNAKHHNAPGLVRGIIAIITLPLLVLGQPVKATPREAPPITQVETPLDLPVNLTVEFQTGALDYLREIDLSDPQWQLLTLLLILSVVWWAARTLRSIRILLQKPEASEMADTQLCFPGFPDIPHVWPTDLPGAPTKNPIPETSFSWNIQGASRVGKFRSENQDDFGLGTEYENKTGFVLCDGAGGHKGGKEAAENAVAYLLPFIDPNSGKTKFCNPMDQLKAAIEKARTNASQEKCEGITTAILAIMENDWLHYATLGDGGLSVIWPDGMVSHYLTPHHQLGMPSNQIAAFIGHDCDVPPRMGSVRLEPGCIVLAMSDGASDIFPFEDFSWSRDQHRKLLKNQGSDLSEALLKQIESARSEDTGAYLHSDNMTLIMALLIENPAREHENG